MTESKNDTVIACIDDSGYGEAVCDYAAWSAKRLDAPLSLLHVIDKPDRSESQNLSGSISFDARESLLQELSELDEQRARIAMEQGKHVLQAARERIEASGIGQVDTRQRHGDLIDTLTALEPDIRMLVMGKRGADTESAHGHIGSHLESVIRTLQKPILIAQQSFTPPERFMIAYDGSPTARKAVEMVAASPLLKGVACHLVMIGETEKNRAAMDEASKLLTDAGFDVTPALLTGNTETALLEYQTEQGIDLLVMGAYGHSRIRHMIVGSTTTAILRRTRVPLMILR